MSDVTVFPMPPGSPRAGLAFGFRNYPNVDIEPAAIERLKASGYLE